MLDIDLTKVRYVIIALVVLFLFSSIIAPTWYLFQFAPTIFHKYDLVKLLILSSAIGFPIVIFNSILAMLVFEQGDTEKRHFEGEFYTGVSVGSATTIAILYLPLILTFFHHVSLIVAEITSIVAQIIFIAIWAKSFKNNYKNKTP